MSFGGYYQKLRYAIKQAPSLEALVIRKHRINIGNSGLHYKTKDGYLHPHQYNTASLDKNDDVQ
ncbi:hypothetical protein O7R01_25425 [Vibrio owensii]|nr:hypothetical protein [Vibrio owensii]